MQPFISNSYVKILKFENKYRHTFLILKLSHKEWGEGGGGRGGGRDCETQNAWYTQLVPILEQI